MRRLLLALTAAAAVSTPALASPTTSVAIDHSTRISLRAAAASVIVGNPAVADVTVVDERTLFLQGKGYGVTEVVVLDPLGRTIWQGDVVVTDATAGAVTVYRGAQRSDMACAAACSTSARSAAARPAPASTTP